MTNDREDADLSDEPDAIQVDGTDIIITKEAVEDALKQWPVEDPEDFHPTFNLHEEAFPYVWALLNDPRIIKPEDLQEDPRDRTP